ncbi:MAG: hypothetical protein NTW61_06095 [Candidatus Melainabacteria bacterium]|nr:hypothetical protein [Candidatus Melainabacteria bacterium]
MVSLLGSLVSTMAAGHLAAAGNNVELAIKKEAGGVVTEVSSLKKGLRTLGKDVYQLVEAEAIENRGKLTSPPYRVPTGNEIVGVTAPPYRIPTGNENKAFPAVYSGFISKTSSKAD